MREKVSVRERGKRQRRKGKEENKKIRIGRQDRRTQRRNGKGRNEEEKKRGGCKEERRTQRRRGKGRKKGKGECTFSLPSSFPKHPFVRKCEILKYVNKNIYKTNK